MLTTEILVRKDLKRTEKKILNCQVNETAKKKRRIATDHPIKYKQICIQNLIQKSFLEQPKVCLYQIIMAGKNFGYSQISLN